MLDDIVVELSKLHTLTGADFVRQLELITSRKEFHLLSGEINIYATGEVYKDDAVALLSVARKAVEHGNKVYILPNPKNIRTSDYIFERKGVYKLFDLKTIVGKNSVSNRLKESIGQTNRVLLNLQTDYNIRRLTSEIRHHFEISSDASEVLIYKGTKEISVKRNIAMSKGFLKMMMKVIR